MKEISRVGTYSGCFSKILIKSTNTIIGTCKVRFTHLKKKIKKINIDFGFVSVIKNVIGYIKLDLVNTDAYAKY